MVTRAPRHRARGFTLIELLSALAMGAVLATVALPGYTHVLQKSRRSDATVALLQVQMAQERHRADHARYGTLAELRVTERSAAGHYRLAMAAAGDDAFEVHALATGAQDRDTTCRRLSLRVDAGRTEYASGSDERTDNGDAANRRCWSL